MYNNNDFLEYSIMQARLGSLPRAQNEWCF